MAKEFEVLDVGYLGSFIEERADNDGDDIKKSITLGVPDNNIWVINPLTGILESRISMGDKNDPQFVQFNGTKPTAPTTDLVIKTIGQTVKITNATSTEFCVTDTYGISDFTYNPSNFPKEYMSCEKSIFFTSNNKLQWPTPLQTNNMLENLSRKIPYDIGFSKKYYRLGKLSHNHLMQIQEDSGVSADFLKRFDVLFLFDSEYPNDIDFSKIKLSYEWDGFSIDENDANNLVYSDYYKMDGAVYANFVFLVSDHMLKVIKDYFSSNIEKRTVFQNSIVHNPLTTIPPRVEEPNFKRLISFVTEPINRPNAESVINTISTKKLYTAKSDITDLQLVQDMIVSEIFTEVQDIFNIESIVSNIQNDGTEDVDIGDELDVISETASSINNAFEVNTPNSSSAIDVVNQKIYNLLQKYTQFQAENNYPSLNDISTVSGSYGIINFESPFTLTNVTVTPTTVTPTTPPQTETPLNPVSIFANFDLPQFAYKRFDYNNDFAISELFYKTKPLFSNGSDRNSVFYLEYPQFPQSKYYLNVKTDTNQSVSAESVFSIAYAHISGSGSSYIVSDLGYDIDQYPSKGLYKKYMAECFSGDDSIVFKNGKRSDHFYILQFNRELFKDKINNGHFQISLAPISSSSNQLINTGSNFEFDQENDTIFKLIDDSLVSTIYSDQPRALDEYYNIVEGTLQDGPIDYEVADGWGYVFPNKGIILFDADMLNKYCNFNTVTASIDGDNARKLFLSISGSCSPNNSRTEHEHWYMRSAEMYADENYFCRINRNEFNYSNNYTYTSGSTMKVFTDKVNNTTKTYVTGIGLYDDSNNLLAVGKFKKPLLKDSSYEYVVNVKLRRI